MYTATHNQNTASVGEKVRITFTIKDEAGAIVDVSSSTAAYKIARRKGDVALLTKTNIAGITLSGNTAIVEFNTNEVLASEEQALGDFVDQLAITKAGDTLYVSEGIITIEPVIS